MTSLCTNLEFIVHNCRDLIDLTDSPKMGGRTPFSTQLEVVPAWSKPATVNEEIDEILTENLTR